MINAKEIGYFHSECHTSINWPQELLKDYSNNELWFWIQNNHRFNTLLWDEEDLARRNNVSDSEIANNKKTIDRLNQQRNDAIEKIDELMLSICSSTKIKINAWHNSETFGSIVDRLSILSLKLYHMSIQSNRTDITNKDIQNALSKLEQLESQKIDLLGCLDNLVQGVIAGEVFFKIYRQHKMYNDPTMNPYLSGLKK